MRKILKQISANSRVCPLSTETILSASLIELFTIWIIDEAACSIETSKGSAIFSLIACSAFKNRLRGLRPKE